MQTGCCPCLSALPPRLQGLSCSLVGCANLGPALRAAVLPLAQCLVAESLRRVPAFNLQASWAPSDVPMQWPCMRFRVPSLMACASAFKLCVLLCLQAMANAASAVSKLGLHMIQAMPTQALLAAFAAHAAALPPPHRPQASTGQHSCCRCGGG